MFTCIWKMWKWLDSTSMEKQPFLGNLDKSNDMLPNEMGHLSNHQSNVTPSFTQEMHMIPSHSNILDCSVGQITDSSNASNYQHSQLLQFPVIWGPVQQAPRLHFHQQKPAMQQNNCQISNDSQQTVKSWESVEHKKKISSNNQQFRSPSAKRPLNGAVTMQGWLHKQGSDGLKVWRKRWFVLSNYCLYYYKGPEEDKILGSILLPSYKVSLCGVDDKVYRKFAFKCEHVNMRTYYLAADSQTVMMEWLRALNLACILQSNNDSDHQSGHSVSSMYNISVDNSDSGFHQLYHSTFQNSHMHHSSSNNIENNSILSHSPRINHCIQPLYANAPPKPRRLTDGGYSSPSPQVTNDRYSPESIVHRHQTPKVHLPRPVMHCNYVPNTGKSLENVYSKHCDMNADTSHCIKQYAPSQEPYDKVLSNISEHNMINAQQLQHNIERRTPDTYGPSKLSTGRGKDAPDYEDVYSDEIIFKRPLSPVTYCNLKKNYPIESIAAQYRAFPPDYKVGLRNHNYNGYKVQMIQSQCDKNLQMNVIPRPHSTDFLKYEVKYCDRANSNIDINQQPRPKSSLERTCNDNYYYSKESYADKMRKSALYLQVPNHSHSNDDGHKTHLYTNHDFNTYPLTTNTEASFNEMNIDCQHQTPTNSNNASEGFHEDNHLNYNCYLNNPSPHIQDMSQYDHSIDDLEHYHQTMDKEVYHNEPLIRSASARILKSPIHQEKYVHEDQQPKTHEGERKREESMKRLLEWKQRMLVSPLNRKLSTNVVAAHDMVNRADCYYQPTGITNFECPLENRSSFTALSQYNSYSSDDEENDNKIKKEKVVCGKQAERTKEGPSDKSLFTISPVLNMSTNSASSISVANTQHIYLNSNKLKQEISDTSSRNITEAYENDFDFKKESSTSINETINSEPDINTDTDTSVINNDDLLDNGDIQKSDSQTSILIFEENNLANTEDNIESNKSKISEIYKRLEVNSVMSPPNTTEENYMTMTPRKSILDPNPQKQMTFDCDENAYMEMTRELDVSLINNELNENQFELMNEGEPYELLCFQENKIEPVYMELNHAMGNQSLLNSNLNKEDNNEKIELPDIIMPSQNKANKSDSSDADDEASKDLDSLDAPCHPRFSLSDTFRPASYYLGASRVLTEFHDSSDSELVSPPPIPTSPPPMEDLDNPYYKPDTNMDNLIRNVHEFSFSKEKNRSHSEMNKSDLTSSNTVLSNKKSSYLSISNLKEQDSPSTYSLNTDTLKNNGSRSSQNSDSDIELRSTKDMNYAQMLKRQPVSEDFYNKFEFFNSNFDGSIDLNRYLKDLEVNKVNSLSKESVEMNSMNKHNQSFELQDYENMCSEEQEHLNLHLKGTHDTMLKIFSGHHRDSSYDTGNFSLDSFGTNSHMSPNGLIQCLQPESRASISAEGVGFYLSSSPQSSLSPRVSSSLSIQEIFTQPGIYSNSKVVESTETTMLNESIPYYYSDLSNNISNRSDSCSNLLTLNNQRTTMTGNKKDITRIVNPISNINRLGNSMHRDSISTENTLAAQARSVSVDFLNLTEKGGQIDKKNIFESDTLKRIKAVDSMSSLHSDSEIINLYPSNFTNKLCTGNSASENMTKVRRTYSMEALLENVLDDANSCVKNSQECDNTVSSQCDYRCNSSYDVAPDDANLRKMNEGDYMWEEDALWQERLRYASQRHTRSLDDLDNIGSKHKSHSNCKHSKYKFAHDLCYVNDNIMTILHSSNQSTDNTYIKSCKTHEGEYAENTATWNINSMKSQDCSNSNAHNSPKIKSDHKCKSSFAIDRETLRHWDLLSSAPSGENTQSLGHRTSAVTGSMIELEQGKASGSMSMAANGTFPRAMTTKKLKAPSQLANGSNRNINNMPDMHLHQATIKHNFNQYDGNKTMPAWNSQKVNWQWSGKMNMSAGELLGRTYEELVLLLIQLRRQSTNTCYAIESGYAEIDQIQLELNNMDSTKHYENLQTLEKLKQRLLELEKQYEKGKPLVNLVDNMVKLGSLYRNPTDHKLIPYVKNRLEFNQHIQERRLLAEERRDWNRLSPNHIQLQEKVHQLYQLDQLLQEESGTLQELQNDKEKIEKALGGLKNKLNTDRTDPNQLQQARKQQALLENELSRVHYMLAQNSKKLEETVAGNARLEQELLVLRQKVQSSKHNRNSPQFSNTGDSLPFVMGTSVMLESELHRVQQLVGDLQRQRQELSLQVHQLTDRSQNLNRQIHPSIISNQQNMDINKKYFETTWRETDLDTMHSIDHKSNCDVPLVSQPPYHNNYDNRNSSELENSYNSCSVNDNYNSDDNQQLNGAISQEKQEIKTVRIVKRESERRQRDREKSCSCTNTISGFGNKWNAVVEEEQTTQNTYPLYNEKNNLEDSKYYSSSNMIDVIHDNVKPEIYNNHSLNESPTVSPTFKSEAARQIIIEMSGQTPEQGTQSFPRRTVPKEKRRHYTAPSNNIIMRSLNHIPTQDSFSKMESSDRRARDDLDMERALRQKTDTPDVVRSTLSSKELKYNEKTIDNILGTPNKICIPERYIPEILPQLSQEEQLHRLRKVESIKKMLTDTTILTSTLKHGSQINVVEPDRNTNGTVSNTNKIVEEKRQREHLLQLNQILAKQVMEMSKVVTAKALASLPLQPQMLNAEEEDLSPITPLPLYQQRDNFYS